MNTKQIKHIGRLALLSCLTLALLLSVNSTSHAAKQANFLTIKDIVKMAEQGMSDDEIIAKIDAAGLFLLSLSQKHLDDLTNSVLHKPVVAHIMQTQFGNLETALAVQDMYFPLGVGKMWQYNITIEGDLLIQREDGIYKRSKASYAKQKNRVIYTITDYDDYKYELSISNNIFDADVVVNSKLSKQQRAILGEALKKEVYWIVRKVKREDVADPNKQQQYDMEVIESVRSKVSSDDRELFRAPIVSVVERTISGKHSKVLIKYEEHLGKVKTPAGVFNNCIVKKDILFTKDGNWTNYTYFAPKVGLIKQYQENSEGKRSYVMELVKYSSPKVNASKSQ